MILKKHIIVIKFHPVANESPGACGPDSLLTWAADRLNLWYQINASQNYQLSTINIINGVGIYFDLLMRFKIL